MSNAKYKFNTNRVTKSVRPTRANVPISVNTSRNGQDVTGSQHKSITNFAQTTTVLVGPKEQLFTVHTELLRRIPFFQKCLDAGMKETQDNIIRMPEDHVGAFTQMVSWLYTKDFSFDLVEEVKRWSEDVELNERDYTTHPEPLKSHFMSMVQTYVLAKKLCAEKLQNYVIDLLCHCVDKYTYLEYDDLEVAYAQEEDSDPFRRLAAFSVACEFYDVCDWSEYTDNCLTYKFAAQDVQRMSFLLQAIQQFSQDPYFPSDHGAFCNKWHTHIDTPKWVSSSRAGKPRVRG